VNALVDFITKLLLVARINVILVVYDRLSKIVYFIAIIEGTLVKERLFRDNVWKLHGLPENIRVTSRVYGILWTFTISKKF